MSAQPGGPAQRRLSVSDIWLSLPLLVVGLFGTRPAGDDQELSRYADVPAFALVALAALSLVLQRVRPQATLALCGAALATYLALGYPYGPILLTAPFAVYAVASRLPLRRAIVDASIFYVVTLAAVSVRFVDARDGWSWFGAVSWALAWAAIVAASVATGAAVRVRRQSDADVRAAAARRAVSEERLRMAQELHDSVGHELAVIAMQAGVALHVLDRDPVRAREALEAIRATSRSSLDGLRAELDLLRTPQGESAPRRPTAGLADVGVLVERIRAGGVDVEMKIDDGGGLPPEVDVAVYRILQESLTNVLRHSGGRLAQVRVHRENGQLVVGVVDDGPGQAEITLPPGAGAGIPGMRARAAELGGTLDAGPRPGGGFAVTARLPVPSAPGSSP
ncbi:MAG TPA: sensor histidine kinase [Jiangellaceae bacterium]|nr:sensor histidine kinase [Jiangellaceae bacterium]